MADRPHRDTITPDQLVALLGRRAELAVLDVRELGVHDTAGHILLSVPVPLSHLELRIGALVPRYGTKVVVYDGGEDGLAERAAERLAALGYCDVAVLGGGVMAWRANGFEVYTGVHVLSKAFGEFVEHSYGTPRLSAREVKARRDAGEDIVVLDGRTLAEFKNFSIPGAYACPNAELPYRVHDLIASPDTLVVVNCAGRTRSIIGAQALINAGLPNPVAALENGTMAWLFEGFALDSGHVNPAAPPSAEGLAKALDAAARLRRIFALRSIDRPGLDRFVAEQDHRSLFRLDVRTREEYEEGHLPGSVWAEGGQLVQATDQWIGTRHARIVLIDDANGVRATITASWLVQLGFDEVYIYSFDETADTLEGGIPSPLVVGQIPTVAGLSASQLQARLGAEASVLLDVSDSRSYVAGHVPSARFAIRARLADGLARLPPRGPIFVAAENPALARLAAGDLQVLTDREVAVLEGGNAAWRAAGLPVEAGETALHDRPDDVWQSPYHQADRLAAFRRYLDWEIDLVKQISRDRTISFRTFNLTAPEPA